MEVTNEKNDKSLSTAFGIFVNMFEKNPWDLMRIIK